MYSLNKEESRMMKEITDRDYMAAVIEKLDSFMDDSNSASYRQAFDKIYTSIISSREENDTLLETKRRAGIIKDVSQSRKSIAGSAFSSAIIYVFLRNKIIGNIREDIFITSKKSKVPDFDKISVINVGGETQKPDCDLIIYTLNENKTLKNCIILSLKTSLRERAGQTYKWKLLMEIASSENNIKEKYNIAYNPPITPIVCFATINFYNEINNPQQRGMFKFFDMSFIAKNLDDKGDFIRYLSEIVAFINERL